MKTLLLILVGAIALSACSSVKNVVVKDIPLQEQQAVLEKYKDRAVWTRVTIEDLGDGGSIPRDEKVTIVDVAMHYQGSVTVQTLAKKNRIVQGLEIERPLTPEKIDQRLTELFWFDDPTIRHVNFIREYDKKTASAIMEHTLFKDMSAAAAEDSWGPPASRDVSDRGGIIYAKWVYPADNSKKTKSIYLEGPTAEDLKVVKWDE